MARPIRKPNLSTPVKHQKKLKPPRYVVPKADRAVTPLIYYGGKTRDVNWIIKEFPVHDCFVDVFGGGGAVTFAKVPARIDVYNDIGNVNNFMRVLRDFPEELYHKLYYSVFSRQLLYDCSARWQEISEYYKGVVEASGKPFREVFEMDADMAVDWAFCWFVVILQSHSHEEMSNSWKVSRGNDLAMAVNNKVDDLYRFAERLRNIMIEDRDFAECIRLYDSPKTLFYCDPPYTHGTRVSKSSYVHEMPIERHKELLDLLNTVKGQVVVSMYSDTLYEKELSAERGWLRKTVSHLSSIQNAKSMADGRDVRTEVLWVKRHRYGLWEDVSVWGYQESSPDVSEISESVEDEANVVDDGERNSL